MTRIEQMDKQVETVKVALKGFKFGTGVYLTTRDSLVKLIKEREKLTVGQEREMIK